MSKGLIFIGIFAALLVAGCQFVTTRPAGVQPQIHTGTEGLVLRWIENSPPQIVYEGSSFDLAFEIWNKGANDVSGGVYVINYNRDAVQLSKESGFIELQGKSLDNPTGEKIIETIPAKAMGLGPGLERLPAKATVDICYEYATIAAPEICIDTDLFAEISSNKKVCRMQSLKLTGQGAPVVLTSVEPKILSHPDKGKVLPQVLLKFRNNGKGIIVRPGRAADACAAGLLKAEDFNKAGLRVTLLDKSMNCQRELVFSKNEAEALCTLPEGIDKRLGTFNAVLGIELEYGYNDAFSREFEIKKLQR
ncbi:MAG: hypothetical protein QXN46_02810 [Candidatus Woesearchaeota archaeon]